MERGLDNQHLAIVHGLEPLNTNWGNFTSCRRGTLVNPRLEFYHPSKFWTPPKTKKHLVKGLWRLVKILKLVKGQNYLVATSILGISILGEVTQNWGRPILRKENTAKSHHLFKISKVNLYNSLPSNYLYPNKFMQKSLQVRHSRGFILKSIKANISKAFYGQWVSFNSTMKTVHNHCIDLNRKNCEIFMHK